MKVPHFAKSSHFPSRVSLEMCSFLGICLYSSPCYKSEAITKKNKTINLKTKVLKKMIQHFIDFCSRTESLKSPYGLGTTRDRTRRKIYLGK